MKKTALILLFGFIFSYAKVTDNTFRLSYQNLHFNNENLGLLETSYLFNFGKFYSGISIYSAITGKRGGFFVGGINAGIKLKIKNLFWDSGIFIGGGGGGHAPQGSGLMSKIYTGLLVPYKHYDFGINLNKIKFKNSAINSTQLGFIIDYDFKDVYFWNKPKFLKGKYSIENYSIKPYISEYIPINCKTTQGNKQEKFSLIGAEITNYKKNYFVFINAAGAFRGKSDGYAEYMLGIGKKLKYFTLKTSIGAAGGGEVKTNGGFIYKFEISKNIGNFSLETGYVASPGGFKAYELKGGYLKKFNFLTTGNKHFSSFNLQKFKIRIYSESYMPSKTIRKNSISKRLDVLNIDLGIYKNKHFAYIINAGSAYNGNSGGYAIGMFGMEYDYKHFFTAVYLGAAGGGNVSVGGGFVSKIKIGYEYKKFFVSLGRIKALGGKLNTTTFSLGFNFNFYKATLN